MRVALASLVLSLSVSACALPPASGGPGRYQPLRAQIMGPRIDGMSFHVNRPSYVALFEIVPGAGTSLVYPSPGMGRMNGFVFSGAHDVARMRRHNAEQYLPAAYTSGLSAPRFFFLVASERPLDLARFGGYGMGLRSAMGMQFASLNAYGAMESLARTVLPSTADDGSWTTDMYVHWPQVLFDSRGRRPGLVPVSCDGLRTYVPLEYLLAAREALCPAREPGGDVEPPQPGDSAGGGVADPRRRAPLPPRKADDDLRERITSSTQLEEPTARRPTTRGVRSGAEVDELERRRVAPRRAEEPRARRGERSRGEASPAREPRSASPRSTGSPRAEPRSRPAASPSPAGRPAAREPTSRPSTRSGNPPRATSGRPGCDPCEQR